MSRRKRNQYQRPRLQTPWWLWTTAAGAIIGVALAASCAPAKADTISDVAFLQTLDGQAIHYPSATFAITVGHEICNDLNAGIPEATEITRLWLITSLDSYDAGYYVGAAVGAYCPGAGTPAGSGREAV
ncbi:MAG TPA: DUF732 domain-containing protein [Gemmatimonadaceae bacterium]|jgi:hypothetical protein